MSLFDASQVEKEFEEMKSQSRTTGSGNMAGDLKKKVKGSIKSFFNRKEERVDSDNEQSSVNGISLKENIPFESDGSVGGRGNGKSIFSKSKPESSRVSSIQLQKFEEKSDKEKGNSVQSFFKKKQMGISCAQTLKDELTEATSKNLDMNDTNGIDGEDTAVGNIGGPLVENEKEVELQSNCFIPDFKLKRNDSVESAAKSFPSTQTKSTNKTDVCPHFIENSTGENSCEGYEAETLRTATDNNSLPYDVTENETTALPTDDPVVLAEDFIECEKCRKLVSVWEMPEHTDYHFAMELQKNMNAEERRPPLQVASEQSKKRKSVGSYDKSKKKSKVESAQGKLDSFFIKSE